MTDSNIVAIVFQFFFATILPALASYGILALRKHTGIGKLGYWPWQIICGLVFGIIAVFGTEFGIETHDATMNVRDAAPIVAGLYFGGPAGIIAGVIGGVERWFSVLWGRGMFTRVGCSAATIIVGFYAAGLNRYLFRGRKPQWFLAMTVGIVAEVLHLLLIFVTNMNHTIQAFLVVRACSAPMILCNGIAVALAGVGIAIANDHTLRRKHDLPDISQTIQRGMLGVAVAGFVISVGFVYALQQGMVDADVARTMKLDLRDATDDICDVVHDPRDLRSRVSASIASRHVGISGAFVAYDPGGAVLGTGTGFSLSDDATQGLYAAASSYEPYNVYPIIVDGTKYLAASNVVEGYLIVALMPALEAHTMRDLSVLVTSFLEVLILAALFVATYLLISRAVVQSILKVNGRLEQITSGDLNVEVDVHDNVEFASLSDGINRTVSSLRDAIAAEGARIERDLMTARAIQTSALPQTFPPFPQIDAFDIYASMHAAREVGGDFYDFFLIDDHRVGFLVADVSDKGIPAALFMMSAKAQLSNYMQADMTLAEAVRTANWRLCQGNETEMFVTAWAAVLDYETGELTYVNAGHNPPLWRHRGSWQWLTKRCGPFLGGFDIARYREEHIMLERGDGLLLYTDGVNEAFSPQDEEFGDDRLEAFLASKSELHPRALVDSLFAELRAWAAGTAQSDDITILALEYGVPPATIGGTSVSASVEGCEEARHFIDAELARRLCPLSTQKSIDDMFTALFEDAVAQMEKPEERTVRIEYVYNTSPNALTVSLTYRGNGDDLVARYITELGVRLDDISCVIDGEQSVVAFRKAW